MYLHFLDLEGFQENQNTPKTGKTVNFGNFQNMHPPPSKKGVLEALSLFLFSTSGMFRVTSWDVIHCLLTLWMRYNCSLYAVHFPAEAEIFKSFRLQSF